MKQAAAKHTITILSVLAMIFFAGYGSIYADSSCRSYSLRAAVLDVNNNEIMLSIGSRDGIEKGQRLEVYKIVKEEKAGKYRKIDVGSVKITEVVNEHVSRASVVSGDIEKNYLAELVIPSSCSCEPLTFEKQL